jgi:hypothetical protein
MKLRASVSGFESVLRSLRRQGHLAAQAASTAAADTFVQELEGAKDGAGISAPLMREQSGNLHSIGVDDPEAINRELGTLNVEPTPWLAPVLPAARGPMRAAAVAAAARAISSRKGKA